MQRASGVVQPDTETVARSPRESHTLLDSLIHKVIGRAESARQKPFGRRELLQP
jgi:hypothetical protein